MAAGGSIGFRDECDGCRTDLHTCLNCAHHDVTAYNECRESNAERILDQDRANRCEYFRPGGRPPAKSDEGQAPISDLEKLFKSR